MFKSVFMIILSSDKIIFPTCKMWQMVVAQVGFGQNLGKKNVDIKKNVSICPLKCVMTTDCSQIKTQTWMPSAQIRSPNKGF